MRINYIILLAGWLCAGNVTAQGLLEALDGKVEMQGAVASGKTPLWLNANKYGLSSLEEGNGYMRAAIGRQLEVDSAKRWGLGYRLDMAVAQGYTSRVVLQQAYVEARWLRGRLSVGSKEEPMQLKDNQLSSGSQTLGINARPVPQIRLSLDDYWAIPFTKGWVSLKGHVAYGITTDGNWQEDFVGKETGYSKNVLYHSKAGYLKLGKSKRWTVELGLEMATQFGGTSHVVDENNRHVTVKGGTGLKDFWYAFVPGGKDATESKYTNVQGNMVGSYVARVEYNADKWRLGVYADHFFEDHSAMFFLDYDGYGSDERWNDKVSNRYFLYDMKDIMLGVDLELKKSRWLKKIVLEYMYTKYQSGPIYHDHTESISDHIGGTDNYYNHYIYGAWQHWGQVIGNPLYRSPIYNDDGTIGVANNRFTAFHLGVAGQPSGNMDYRVLATYQKGLGTYSNPYRNPKESVNLLGEVTYRLDKGSWAGTYIVVGVGADIGSIYGHNYGGQLTIGRNL